MKTRRRRRRKSFKSSETELDELIRGRSKMTDRRSDSLLLLLSSFSSPLELSGSRKLLASLEPI